MEVQVDTQLLQHLKPGVWGSKIFRSEDHKSPMRQTNLAQHDVESSVHHIDLLQETDQNRYNY